MSSVIRPNIISFFKRIDELCKPNPKYTPRHSEQETAHQKNKSIVITCACVIICFACDTFIRDQPVKENLDKIILCILSIFYVFLSHLFHPQIYKFYYMLVVGFAFGPSLLYSNPENIYVSFVLALIVTLFVQLITGGYLHFLISAVFQNILVNTYYQSRMREALSQSTPEEILKDLTNALNLSMAIQAVCVCSLGYFLERARQKALDFEQKKTEAENQKVFLLGFSHELRNLINSLTGNVKLASLENLGTRAKEFLHNAELCGELLLHMINNILDTGKSQINELEINLTPTQTYENFQGIWAICAELVKRKDLSGCMRISKRLPRNLMMDHHRLAQIFLNLVGNAVKFTDRGSIDISVEWLSDKQSVSQECFRPYPFDSADDEGEGLYEKQRNIFTVSDEFFFLTQKSPKINPAYLKCLCPPLSRKGILKMTVIDSGCGMTSTQMNRLFQKFSQVTADEGKKKLGTGLGLFITKQLCEKMNGEVRAFSEKGKGSAFIFCLPAETTTDERLPLQISEDLDSMKVKLAAKQLRVLIVDDAPANHIILRNFFNMLSIEANEIAVNGLEAYYKYLSHLGEEKPFHIVAMDLDMPIMNGKEASRKIRELEKEKGVNPCFLLIVSGNCVQSEVHECMDRNGSIRADAFIRKPIKMEDLVMVVSSRFLSLQSKR